MKKQNSKSKSRYVTPEQAKALLDFFSAEELPEHDSPFKLYFNGKLIGSANPPNQTDNDKTKTNESVIHT